MPYPPALPVQPRGESPVAIRALGPDELPAAAALLAAGMLHNPLHVKVFGADPDRRQRRLRRFLDPLTAYVHANGEVLGAHVQDELVGVLGMIAPGRCRPGLRERLSFARALLTAAPPPTLLRMQCWLAAWALEDPADPHWHIGPLAVQPEFRRRGIGRRLMTRCVEKVDAAGTMAWLETDLEINAEFYRTLGFVVAAKRNVLGVPVWFMSRPLAAHPD